MKVAVTYDKDEGMIFQHFGHTEYFKLYDVDDGEVQSSEVISTGDTGHEALAVMLKRLGVNVLICGGIGPGAVSALDREGILVYGGIVGLADGAVEALLRGLLRYNPAANCDHHHDEGEEHQCGHHCGGCH